MGSKNDLDSIESIVKEVVHDMNNIDGNYQWDDTYPVERDFLSDIANKTLWVAVNDSDEILGFAAITLEQPSEYSKIHWDDGAALAVVPHRLAVNPKHRSAGVAQMLMKKGENVASSLGYPYVRVDTNESNTKMRNLLAKLGYKYVGSTRLDDCTHDILFACYEKEVSKL
eukprot:gene34585-44713_t